MSLISEEILALLKEVSVYDLAHELLNLRNEKLEFTRAINPKLHKALKRRCRQLADQKNELVAEVSELKDTLCKQDEIITRLNYTRQPFQQLPQELLRMIFYYALPPPYLIDRALTCERDSPWALAMRSKLSLVAVCKAWCRAGVEFLYEDVAFLRVEQLHAFYDTLSNAVDADYGYLVKRIGVSCCVPESDLETSLFKETLEEVLDRCPRVEHFVYNPFINGSEAMRLAVHFTQSIAPLAPRCAPTLTRLELGANAASLDIIWQIGNLSHNLVSLSIHLPRDGQFSLPDNCVLFDRLKSLRCAVTSSNCHHLGRLAAFWTMPHLERLTFELSNVIRNSVYIPSIPYETFCVTHGRNLKFLHLQVPTDRLRRIDTVHLLRLCPSLEHLVFDGYFSIPPAHPNIKWIDVYTLSPEAEPSADDDYTNLLDSLTKERFPSLLQVRSLDCALLYIADLPTIFPPRMSGSDAGYLYPGIDITEKPGHILRNDLDYADPEGSDEDSAYGRPESVLDELSSDSDYERDSIDEADDTR